MYDNFEVTENTFIPLDCLNSPCLASLSPTSIMLLFLTNDFFTPENLFLLISFFALGTVIGSFLNVVIHRLPLAESIVFPNSHCPNCNSAIHFYDNVPVISWLILGGRCRSCRAPISYRYPLVELLTGVVYAVFFWHSGLTYLLPFNILFGTAMIVLIFIDAAHFYLPNAINYPGLVIALIARLLFPLALLSAPFDDLAHYPLNGMINLPLWATSLLGALMGGLAGGGFLWLVGWLWKQLRGIEAMGLGDVKMMLMVGAFLGWRLTLLSIFLAALVGAFTGVTQIVMYQERDFNSKIPFGIFLGLGSIISLLSGAAMIDWYLKTFITN
ncbi:MAG: prepilin peptidase [Pyrinomonadaceae bacterium]